MQWRASLVVYLVDIKLLMLCKVIEADWLVALGCNMQAVGTIDVCHPDITLHLIHNQIDQLEVSMVGGKVKGCKLLISVRVYPGLDAGVFGVVADLVLQSVLVDRLEALSMVFEGT